MIVQSFYISMVLVTNIVHPYNYIATTCLIQGYVMKGCSHYLISKFDEKKLSFLKDDMTQLYFVGDKSSFVQFEKYECLLVVVFQQDKW